MTAASPGLSGASLGFGLVASLALHVGLLALTLPLFAPEGFPDQARPRSDLRIETQSVAARAAPAQEARAAALNPARPEASPATQGEVRLEAAPAVTANPPLQTAAPPPALQPQAPPPPAALPPIAAAESLAPVTQAAQPLPAAAAEAQAAAEAAPSLAPLPASLPDIAPVTAELAYGGAALSDPVSLEAIAAFMRPGSAKGDPMRDGLTGLLASIDCARLQAEFDPATGSLALRGHLPDTAARGPLLAALQAQIGQGIGLRDETVILPPPQCGALSGIAGLGLPQSQDQLTNPRLIGPDAQARSFAYRGGDPLVLDLQAPDYDAYLYVDYFDAQGQVLHLAPNAAEPLRLIPAGQALTLGQGAFRLTVGPPYGQEIVAAFAASVPLYAEERPLVEPAGPYLDWLAARLAEVRAKTPDFKGEWVYFMVSTAP